MSPLTPRVGGERQAILEAAARERARNRRRRAIALYRSLLAFEPGSPELHAKLAPLLAETGQAFDAWQSYRAVVHGALRAGREDRGERGRGRDDRPARSSMPMAEFGDGDQEQPEPIAPEDIGELESIDNVLGETPRGRGDRGDRPRGPRRPRRD